MLPFILYKDLHASPLQITAIIALKPLVSIFSVYWSAAINKRKDRLVSNVIGANICGHLPFFFFPLVDNAWFFVVSFGFYMMMARGGVPAWMEILKLNIPQGHRERLFAFGSSFEYVGGGILPFAMGWVLDGYFQAWRWIFPITAVVSLVAAIFQYRIPIKIQDLCIIETARPSLSKQICGPWKSAWELLRRRPDFFQLQLGFMLGGTGLVLMQPALPVFFVDVLQLSYTELAVALTLFKGVGFAVTSPLWARWINKIDIYRFLCWVSLLAALFPLCLLLAPLHMVWLYVGYLVFGIMQAGSELSWNMSGPIFAKEEDSSIYSSVNILTVGLRGCFAPVCGSLICFWSNSSTVMVLGFILCLLAAWRMGADSKKLRVAIE